MLPVRALGNVPRGLLAAAAFAAFASAFAGVPLDAQGAARRDPATPAPTPAQRAAPLAIVLPRRDPFAGGGAPEPPTARTPAPAAAIPLPAALGPLPPNAGAGPLPFPLASETSQVRAVITGAHPFALVEDAGTTRLVTVGDAIAGDTIAAITADGVRLAHGGTIAVAPSAAAARPGSGGTSP